MYMHMYMCHYWYTTIMNYCQVESGVYMYDFVYNICMVYMPVLVYNCQMTSVLHVMHVCIILN